MSKLKDMIKNPFQMRVTGGGNRWNATKPEIDQVPYCKIKEESYVWTINKGKYGNGNWKDGMPWSSVLNCMFRHMFALAEGEWRDPESGRPHAAHIACNVSMLIYYWTFGKGTPDLARMEDGYAIDLSAELEAITNKINEVAEKYKDVDKNEWPTSTKEALYDVNYVPYQKKEA